jgi:hypothetical protein
MKSIIKSKTILYFFITLTFISFSCGDKNKSFRQDSCKTPTETLSIKTQENSHRQLELENDIDEITQVSIKRKLEQETDYLNDDIGEIVLEKGHYAYRVKGMDYSGQQTINSCGIWAVRRKLRHMYHLKVYAIEENAWYKDSDEEMRSRLANLDDDIPKEELNRISGNGFIYECGIVRLQILYGISFDYAKVYAYNVTNTYSNTKEALFVYAPLHCLYLASKRMYTTYDSDFSTPPDTGGFVYDDTAAESLGCVSFHKRL